MKATNRAGSRLVNPKKTAGTWGDPALSNDSGYRQIPFFPRSRLCLGGSKTLRPYRLPTPGYLRVRKRRVYRAKGISRNPFCFAQPQWDQRVGSAVMDGSRGGLFVLIVSKIHGFGFCWEKREVDQGDWASDGFGV